MTSPRNLLLAAVAAAVCVPATAQASTVELAADGTVLVRAAAGELNNIHIKPEGTTGVRVKDFGATAFPRGSKCLHDGFTNEVVCRTGVVDVDVALGDDNDLYIGQHGFPTVVNGEAGNDMYMHDGKTGLTTTRTDFRGGPGLDTANYDVATAGVIVTKDGIANDGRTINGTTVIDRDNIRPDVERLVGSRHNDSLNGSNVGAFPGRLVESFDGNKGNDILTGSPADDGFDMGREPDGADVIRGGGGRDAVLYTNRTTTVHVSVGTGTRDDGAAGEGDDVRADIEQVEGGKAADTISMAAGSNVALFAFGGPGNDTLIGANGPDLLMGQAGADFMGGNAGADTLLASDGERDQLDCGTNLATAPDSASRDAVETFIRNCESSQVGKLSLKARGSTVDVSWTHPKAWKKLRSVTVRVLDEQREIGAIEIKPRAGRLVASGAVELGRRSTLRHEGKTVSARLALQVDEAFAGRTLAFAVEAVDVDGRRQVER
jgi:Ca2+-binding RTX toxin-like protein